MYYCTHRHNGIEHPNCYIRYKEKSGGRIGYLDIESSNLDADFGVMYSWAIKTKGSNEILTDRMTRKDALSYRYDRELVRSLTDAISTYDIIYTYYGSRFDIPYIRTRAMFYREAFPLNNSVTHVDLWFAARSKMKLHSNRLANVTSFLGIEGKTPIDSKYWVQALSGNDTALRYIQKHNIADVKILEKFHERIEPYMGVRNTSI
jgi:uncharacterized protein YprB with RNaseH-like and TPR domain